ncbi:hypothetical protein GCM10009799_45730 [Nocardiopsis rhodophaea]|uniref:Uncharacterized protein n=1 Tax=Nocardiopsis rhodophaea TaxID=280238 RepID=A0ABP5F1C1_9ACTN
MRAAETKEMITYVIFSPARRFPFGGPARPGAAAPRGAGGVVADRP